MQERDHIDGLERAQEQAYYNFLEQGQEEAYDASQQEYEAMQREQSAAYDAMQRAQYEEHLATEREKEQQERFVREYFESVKKRNPDDETDTEFVFTPEQIKRFVDGRPTARPVPEVRRLTFLQLWWTKTKEKLRDTSRTRPTDEAKRTKKLFRGIELAAVIIPVKTRKESFEPAFEDAKDDYLAKRRKFRGHAARTWLAFCFCLHIIVIVGQSLLTLCSEKTKKALWAAFGGIITYFSR
jgi:hypothetical protein